MFCQLSTQGQPGERWHKRSGDPSERPACSLKSLSPLLYIPVSFTYLCTYCEIWLMRYFSIFVLTFQTNIKFNNCHIIVFFILFAADCLHAIKPHLITARVASRLRVIYVCFNAIGGLIITSLNKMRSHSCPRRESDCFSLTLCFYRARIPAGMASQAACGGYRPPPVREAVKSALWQAPCKKPQTIKARPGGFGLLGELFLLRIRREASGGWRVLTSGPDSLLCVKTLLCFCAFVYPACYHAPASGLT